MDIGLVFALITAVCFAMASIFARRGVAQAGESFSALVVAMSANLLIISLVVTFASEWDKVWSISLRGLVLLGGAGIIQSAVGRFLFLTSIRHIGANKTSAIVKTNTLYAVILGIIVLNESLTIPLALGISGIIIGVILVSTEKQGVNEEKHAGPSNIRAKGIAAGLGAGLCWGLAVILIKPGIAEIGSPLAGAFVTYTTASLITVNVLFRRELRRRLAQLSRSALIPLAIAGVFGTGANLFRNLALNYSPVSLVMPITSTSAILVVIFSFILNRNLEVFTWRIIIGVVAVVAGLILLST